MVLDAGWPRFRLWLGHWLAVWLWGISLTVTQTFYFFDENKMAYLSCCNTEMSVRAGAHVCM